ncbi:MAG: tRNA (adenosine(37)-N6)-threonylcarbamoyltransferase complex transferase subunit TsaD, partial [Candidatus Limnocylindria bacterium]
GGHSPPPSLVLSIETSCDETGVAVVEDGRRILASVVASQSAHERTGGIVPEVAAREHLRALDPSLREALRRAELDLAAIDTVAATVGPGLIGALLVGASYARGLALSSGKPFVGVNHLEGHVYANWLYEAASQPLEPGARLTRGDSVPPPAPPFPPEPELPAIVLVVSGAHTDLVRMDDHRSFHLLGRSVDDAAGEAFDKVARLLGLGFPGGPVIERAARDGDPAAFTLPKADLPGRYDISFSGLKTAVLRLVRGLEPKGPLPVADIAASFQRTVNEMLAERVARATAETPVRTVMLGGGVAANLALREQIARRISVPLRVPPPKLCIDNGAMIGAAAFYQTLYRAGEAPTEVRSTMPLAH